VTAPLSQRKFVLTDPGENNNNKFWEASLEPGGVRCKWGRVGTKGQEKFYPGESLRHMESRIREKTGKGYKEVALLEQRGGASASALDNYALSKVAEEQIAQGDQGLASLVKRLAEANRHEIVQATGGQITFNADGYAQTALGVVQRKSVLEARAQLTAISQELSAGRLNGDRSMKAISAYLQLIPQKVGARRGWHEAVFGTAELIEAQYDLLDKLEQSIEQAEKVVEAMMAESTEKARSQSVFEVKVSLVTDEAVIKRIKRLYQNGVNRMHVSRELRIKNIYTIDIPSMREAFEADGAKLGGIEELWHGTRIFNVLSILKSGLVIPRSTDGHVCGRMFGDGLYFSDQSTKSANYSAGYWDPTARHNGPDRNCFMFLADVAMGRAYLPERKIRYAPSGFDSVFAKAGVCQDIRNNEMIVYRLGQANLKYLIELER